MLLDGETVKLRDLGSLNGTLRNGEGVLETVELTAGDRITIGPIVITLGIDDEPNQEDEERVQLHIGEDETEAP